MQESYPFREAFDLYESDCKACKDLQKLQEKIRESGWIQCAYYYQVTLQSILRAVFDEISYVHSQISFNNHIAGC